MKKSISSINDISIICHKLYPPKAATHAFSFRKFFLHCSILFAGILFFCLTLHFLLFNPITASGNRLQATHPKATVVIDPGHGGRDPGKVGIQGTLEKEINLQIALILKELLTAQNIQVMLTRTEDRDLATEEEHFKISDMKERLQLIQNSEADVVISIHQNSYTDPQVLGAQCFYYTDSMESHALATILQQQIIVSTNQKKQREIKSNGDYYLLKNSSLPTVIIECGFLSNEEEEALLNTKEYQRKMAYAIHLGILQYLNQKTK